MERKAEGAKRKNIRFTTLSVKMPVKAGKVERKSAMEKDPQ